MPFFLPRLPLTALGLLAAVAVQAQQDLVIPAGYPYGMANRETCRNIVINNGSSLNIYSNLTVTGSLIVQDGGTLSIHDNAFVEPGSVELQDEGTLRVCGPQGLRLNSTTTGEIRLAGRRTLSPTAGSGRLGVF